MEIRGSVRDKGYSRKIKWGWGVGVKMAHIFLPYHPYSIVIEIRGSVRNKGYSRKIKWGWGVGVKVALFFVPHHP